ncbi:MAG TPA: transposase [Pirellulales bacterium]|nr:transposase [Pirellulales bacterium]
MGNTLAIHWTVTTHGTWLHGDPRGSWRNGKLIGPDPLLHQTASQAMNGDQESLSAHEIDLAAEAFGTVCRNHGHRVLAATIRSTHAHLVFAPLSEPIEKVTGWIKRQSSAAIFGWRRQHGRSTPQHLWTARRFLKYIFDEQHLINTIEYVRRHNLEAGLPADPFPWIESLSTHDI